MNDHELKRRLRERNEALARLDLNYARTIMPYSTDRIRLAAMHKARYEIPSLPDELREESRRWLEQHGFQRHRGLPWPPPGVLDD